VASITNKAAMITFENLPETVGQIQKSQERTEKMVSDLIMKLSGGTPGHDKLMTVTEAAAFINLSVPTIYSLVHKGAIPTNKKRKRLYFLQSELTDWIISGRRKTIAEIESEQYLKPLKNRR
jgi:excisionase family DNA binding protein